MRRLSTIAFLAVACADFTNAPDPAFGLPDIEVAEPTLSGDVQPIFSRRCSIGGCHSLATRQAGLALTEGTSHAQLVNRPAVLRTNERLVVPFRADSSWLMAMLEAEPSRRGNLPRMPLASTPLTPNQLRTIANWINRGARDD